MSQAKKRRRQRRKFTREFKADVVKLCRSGNESIREVSARLSESTVRTWVKQVEVDEQGDTGKDLTTDEKAEMARLRRELKRVTQDPMLARISILRDNEILVEGEYAFSNVAFENDCGTQTSRMTANVPAGNPCGSRRQPHLRLVSSPFLGLQKRRRWRH